MTKRIKFGVLAAGLVAGLYGSTASAAFIGVVGNNSIDGSLCVGFDCVANEAFGFDTIRLKENNLRLDFQDTSNTASFPPNDWRIIINDSSNGGANHFSIEDRTGGNQVIRAFAGARNNALVIDSQGDLGLGTSTPAVDIDIKTGNTPTVRLQQDGTSGFTPQTWDMAGNEANFFVRDATNGSTLPFRIRPGADTDSLAIDADNLVGMGTSSPHSDLDIRNSAADVIVTLSRNNSSSTDNWQIKNKNSTGTLNIGPQGGNTPIKVDSTAVTNLLRLGLTASDMVNVAGNMTLTGTLTTGGSCSIGCDRVFTADYDLPSVEDHAKEMWAKGYLPNVGPTEENGRYDISNKVLRMLNELEQAHIYIAQMHERVATLEAKLEAKE